MGDFFTGKQFASVHCGVWGVQGGGCGCEHRAVEGYSGVPMILTAADCSVWLHLDGRHGFSPYFSQLSAPQVEVHSHLPGLPVVKASKEKFSWRFRQASLLCNPGLAQMCESQSLPFYVVQLRRSVTWPSVIYFCICSLVTSHCWVMNLQLKNSAPVSSMASFSLHAQGKSDFPQRQWVCKRTEGGCTSLDCCLTFQQTLHVEIISLLLFLLGEDYCDKVLNSRIAKCFMLVLITWTIICYSQVGVTKDSILHALQWLWIWSTNCSSLL